jgi:SAM-dependent methyltransferase
MQKSEKMLKRHWDELASLDPDQSVIDPKDTKGHKNRYLGGIRDEALASALRGLPHDSLILDLGCGSGSGSISLLRAGWRIVGVDISLPLLRQAALRCEGRASIFVQSDGSSIPVQPGVVDAAVTYGVLIYAVEDDLLASLLRQLRETLKPGGRIVLIEQARRRSRLAEGGLKRFRSPDDWRAAVVAAGFEVEHFDVLRHGRFPGTLLIKYGLVPRLAFPFVRRIERAIGRLFGVLPWDYADLRIVASAPDA